MAPIVIEISDIVKLLFLWMIYLFSVKSATIFLSEICHYNCWIIYFSYYSSNFCFMYFGVLVLDAYTLFVICFLNVSCLFSSYFPPLLPFVFKKHQCTTINFFIFFLLFKRFFYFLFFWPHHAACGILVPQPGIEPRSTALEAWSLNCWTTREAPFTIFKLYFLVFFLRGCSRDSYQFIMIYFKLILTKF